MQTSDWIALAGIAAAIATVTAGALIKHMMDDERFKGKTESRIEHIEDQIGDHETGIRGEMHRHTNLIGRLRGIVYFVGNKLKVSIMDQLEDKDE